jgi:hypothetical protein
MHIYMTILHQRNDYSRHFALLDFVIDIVRFARRSRQFCFDFSAVRTPPLPVPMIENGTGTIIILFPRSYDIKHALILYRHRHTRRTRQRQRSRLEM